MQSSVAAEEKRQKEKKGYHEHSTQKRCPSLHSCTASLLGTVSRHMAQLVDSEELYLPISTFSLPFHQKFHGPVYQNRFA